MYDAFKTTVNGVVLILKSFYLAFGGKLSNFEIYCVFLGLR